MSLDLKLAVTAFALSCMFVFISAGASWICWTIDRAIASSGHEFYLKVTGKEPKCATCPFSGRCPYAGSGPCQFTRVSNTNQ